MKWNGFLVKSRFKRGAEEGLYEAMEFLLDEMNKDVPHDEGTLMRSGDFKVKGLQAVIGYDTPYAVRLHEHPEYNFRGGRKGKWVEDKIKDTRIQNKMLNHIAKKMRQRLR